MITGYGPDVDVRAAGFDVQAFVTLEIAQGAIEDVRQDLEGMPGILEAHAATGSGDVLCRVAASSHEALQQTLVDLDRSASVVRSTSVVALSQLVPWRTLPLLESEATPDAGRSGMHRAGGRRAATPPDRLRQRPSTTTWSGRPLAAQLTTFPAALRRSSTSDSAEYQATCGVSSARGWLSRGWPAGGGSWGSTSRPTPASRPSCSACTTASGWTSPPRAVLTR